MTNTILDAIVAATKPRFVRIAARWNVRGGIYTNVVVEHRKKGWNPAPAVALRRQRHALVMWAKVPGTAEAATASGRPAPYNAIGRSTRGDAAAPDVVFDLSHLLP